jgi:hypothetical protein
MSLKMTEFLLACKIPLDLASYKVHLATSNTDSPLDAFRAGTFKEWQEHQTRNNFTKNMVIGLIELPTPNQWLFAGVFKVLEKERKSEKHTAYQTELLPDPDGLIGRLVVAHARIARQPYLIGNDDGGAFYVDHILEKKLSVEEFPGYHEVCVQHSVLKTIINQNAKSWVGALSDIKGVYYIADRLTGKGYVGSATGNSGIWQRWAEYAQTIHGDNKELRALLKERGNDHCNNLQWSILEIADSRASAEEQDKHVRARESYWKNVLLTRVPFGYNDN